MLCSLNVLFHLSCVCPMLCSSDALLVLRSIRPMLCSTYALIYLCSVLSMFCSPYLMLFSLVAVFVPCSVCPVLYLTYALFVLCLVARKPSPRRAHLEYKTLSSSISQLYHLHLHFQLWPRKSLLSLPSKPYSSRSSIICRASQFGT